MPPKRCPKTPLPVVCVASYIFQIGLPGLGLLDPALVASAEEQLPALEAFRGERKRKYDLATELQCNL